MPNKRDLLNTATAFHVSAGYLQAGALLAQQVARTQKAEQFKDEPTPEQKAALLELENSYRAAQKAILSKPDMKHFSHIIGVHSFQECSGFPEFDGAVTMHGPMFGLSGALASIILQYLKGAKSENAPADSILITIFDDPLISQFF